MTYNDVKLFCAHYEQVEKEQLGKYNTTTPEGDKPFAWVAEQVKKDYNYKYELVDRIHDCVTMYLALGNWTYEKEIRMFYSMLKAVDKALHINATKIVFDGMNCEQVIEEQNEIEKFHEEMEEEEKTRKQICEFMARECDCDVEEIEDIYDSLRPIL
jgi:altronate dehydratase